MSCDQCDEAATKMTCAATGTTDASLQATKESLRKGAGDQATMHDRTGIDGIEKLRESEAQFRLIAENLPGLCWISDGEGNLLWANREWHAMFDGTSAEQGDPGGICHPEDLPVLRDLWRRMRAIGAAEAVQLRLRGRDNIYRPYSSRAVPVRDAKGEVVRWCGVQIDLSDQHAHHRRQTVLRAFHDGSRDLIEPEEFTTLTRSVAATQFRLPAEGLNLDEVERQLLVQALERAGGNQTQAGQLLGINRDQVRYRIEKFGLVKS